MRRKMLSMSQEKLAEALGAQYPAKLEELMRETGGCGVPAPTAKKLPS
jgi:hypothetical protein